MNRGAFDHIAEIVARRRDGHTYEQIGAEYDVSRERIRQLLRKVGAAGRIPRLCRFPGCEQRRLVSRAGYCPRHRAKKWHRPESWLHGVPYQIARHIHPEPNSGCWLWGGCVNEVVGYGHLNWGGRNWTPHRLIVTLLLNGGVRLPRRSHVHHLCSVKLCCNPAHLAVVDAAAHASEHRRLEALEGRGWQSTEARARRGAAMALISSARGAYTGVVRAGGRWRAQIGRRYLGTFDSKIEAALTRDAAAVERYGSRAWLNREHFPEVATAHALRGVA